MTDQVDDVRERLSGQWRLGVVDVHWMVLSPSIAKARPELRQVKVHAVADSSSMSLCGSAMVGSWRKRRYVNTELRCADCLAYLQQNGKLT